MSVLRFEIRAGAYADSIVLMQLQGALAGEPGVEDAGAVMATAANLELLAANGLRPEELAEPRPSDLVVAVRAESAEAAQLALGRIDELLSRRRGEGDGAEDGERRPRTLAAAAHALPDAEWVLISVPGRYAAAVAGEALDLGKHVFLYSDNVSLADEVALKRRARDAGRLMMGPDCGTAIVGGLGFGFANRVRRGPIGLVGASGTGLQAVASRIHALGGGISQALGTGGRDVSREVGGITALQCLDLLARDTRTRVIVLVAKPPAPAVTADLLAAARQCGKPVVVWFLGAPAQRDEGTGGVGEDGILYAADAEAAAWRAVDMTRHVPLPVVSHARRGAGEGVSTRRAAEGDLRALLVGGTLAYEAQIGLRTLLHPIHSNAPLLDSVPIDATGRSAGHTILDLGADELTVGRPHPMIDQGLRLRRMRQEAADPKTGVLLLDVVLGYGAHADPAAELAPAIAELLEVRPELEIVVGMVGTDEDPQNLASQTERLREAGATVCGDFAAALEQVRSILAPPPPTVEVPVALEVLDHAPAAINVGVELFYAGLVDQGARAIQVDWRPPAGGDERLQSLLAKMRG
jgi:FdrA protein